MMDKRNRYRNPVRIGTVLRIAFVGILIVVIGGGLVFLRNQHVKKGDLIRQVEDEIVELDHERQLWELRVATAKDRIELSRRLRWMGSDLRPIDPARVLKLRRPAGLDLEISDMVATD